MSLSVSDWKSYELGVADAIAHKAAHGVSVEHNLRLPGRRTARRRQVDIAVRGSVFGLSEGLLVVDCKLRSRRVSVSSVGAFLELVDDVGADFGMLVASSGVTATAAARANDARLRVRVLARDELDGWSPPGTRSVRIAVPTEAGQAAWGALLEAGYRVRDIPDPVARDERHIEAYRLVGVDDAALFSELAIKAIEDAGIQCRVTGSAVVIGGGTPAHAWVPVFVPGITGPVRVCVATEAELLSDLERIAGQFGLPASELEARPPDGWPSSNAF